MVTDILTAKKELYNLLKSNSSVIGAGIREKYGTEWVVIFLMEPDEELLNLIPREYKGNKVAVEIRSIARLMQTP